MSSSDRCTDELVHIAYIRTALVLFLFYLELIWFTFLFPAAVILAQGKKVEIYSNECHYCILFRSSRSIY